MTEPCLFGRYRSTVDFSKRKKNHRSTFPLTLRLPGVLSRSVAGGGLLAEPGGAVRRNL